MVRQSVEYFVINIMAENGKESLLSVC